MRGLRIQLISSSNTFLLIIVTSCFSILGIKKQNKCGGKFQIVFHKNNLIPIQKDVQQVVYKRPISSGILYSVVKLCFSISRSFQYVMAGREGFEPSDRFRPTVFKTVAFDRSAICPYGCLLTTSLVGTLRSITTTPNHKSRIL